MKCLRGWNIFLIFYTGLQMTQKTSNDYKIIYEEIDTQAIKLIAEMLYEKLPGEDLTTGMMNVLPKMVAKTIFTICQNKEDHDEMVDIFAGVVKDYLKLSKKLPLH